ncbi:MAG: amidase family protein, partial [Chthoniobacteraceae bacterium]
MDLTSLSVAELQQKLRARELSPLEALTALDERISQVDPRIQGYLSRDLDLARKAAESADVSLPLGGVPIAIKDAINVNGEACKCASKILEGYKSTYDATVIAKLRKAGAIPFGRTNMDEFAMGSST